MSANVLLVEDDPSLQRFVRMALDDQPISLECCDTVGKARQLVAAGDFKLVLTDLTLADGSAIEFAEEVARNGRTRVAVFSAGITPRIQARLESAKVWRILHKPVSVAALSQCVSEALPSASAADGSSGAATFSENLAVDPDDVERAVRLYFGGNRSLWDRYARHCRIQFASDLKECSASFIAFDFQTLRRQTHSLKTVFRMLGLNTAMDATSALEAACTAEDIGETSYRWLAFQAELSKHCKLD